MQAAVPAGQPAQAGRGQLLAELLHLRVHQLHLPPHLPLCLPQIALGVFQKATVHGHGHAAECLRARARPWQPALVGGKIASRVLSRGERVGEGAGALAAFQRAPYDVMGPMTHHSSTVAMRSAALVHAQLAPPTAASHSGTGGAHGRGTQWVAWGMVGVRVQWPGSGATGHWQHNLGAISRTMLLQHGHPLPPSPALAAGT